MKSAKIGFMPLYIKLYEGCGLQDIRDRLEPFYEKMACGFEEHGITVVSGDLSLVRDRNGTVYKIEKYCYSKPRNLITEGTEGTAETGTCLSASSPPETKEENNKFRFRVGAVCSARGV